MTVGSVFIVVCMKDIKGCEGWEEEGELKGTANDMHIVNSCSAILCV